MQNHQILHNRYQIQEHLGKKAGRITLLAKDLKTENMVVIKLITFSHEFEWDDLTLFEREADTLKNLKHEAIPKYLDYFELNEENYKGFALVQNYIPAKSLENYLEEGRTFTEEEIKNLAKSLLEILIYIHQQNPPIIHRDIKPSNILLAKCLEHSIGKTYLVDFGSVQNIANQESGIITIVETYGYMPPEQFRGRTRPTSDLYSLGATLIDLAGNHPANLPQKEGKIQLESLVSLSPSFIYWINKLIEPSLDKRFASAEEALENLENLHQIQIESYQKPANSKIILNKDDQKIQIVFPPDGLSFNREILFSSTSLYLVWASFLLLYNLIEEPSWDAISKYEKLSLFFITIVLLYSAFVECSKILFLIFEKSVLTIDKQQICFTHQILGLKFPITFSSLTKHIQKLEIKELYLTGEDKLKGILSPVLIIWAGSYKYQISRKLKKYITKSEIEWLSHELSEWLGFKKTDE